MSDHEKTNVGPGLFALSAVGMATLVVGLVGVVAGLISDDFPKTFGLIVAWGMGIAAVVIVGATALRKS